MERYQLKLARRMILLFLYMFVSSSILLFHGPYPALKNYVIDSFTTSMHGYLLRPLSLFTLSGKVIAANTPNLTSSQVTFTSNELTSRDFQNVNDPTIRIETYRGSTFTANVMLVRDPNRLAVAVTRDIGRVGQTVSQLTSENQAVAGVNAGAFRDTNWQGTGGIPLGITISNGRIVEASSSNQPIIGLTNTGALVAGSYSLTQLENLHVTQAVSFGPVLIQNGQDIVQGDGGWGYAPRTAIGQTQNGTIILAVTDGRFVHGPNNLGASLSDMAQLMLHYGAVVAANLDGGSSATMVYRSALVNQPTDILGEREVATAFVIMPEHGSTA